jgi:choline dehydrogenase
MLSGVGSADELRRFGIEVKSNLPGVGQNMQDHNDASLFVETKENYGYSGEDRGLRMLRNGLQYTLFGSGPVSSTGSEVTAFVDPNDLSALPTIQFYCMGTIYPSAERPNPPPGMTLIANLVAPKSRGHMRLRSADPKDRPIIDPNWLSEKQDLGALVAGVRFLFRTIREPDLKSKVVKLHSPIDERSSDDEIANYCRQITNTNWHPVGSCRMGRESDPEAVVDSNLKVLGIGGLRVFDGSIMPTIIRANTNAPIMAIAEKGVDLMMAKSGSGKVH